MLEFRFSFVHPKYPLQELWNVQFLQKTMEAFMIILSATQLFYIAAIHGAAAYRR